MFLTYPSLVLKVLTQVRRGYWAGRGGREGERTEEGALKERSGEGLSLENLNFLLAEK